MEGYFCLKFGKDTFMKLKIDRDRLFFFLWLSIVLLGLFLRCSGLFRGLSGDTYTFHPDEAKQVKALYNYLHGTYIWYVGSPYYDGYPFGLNHLDEYILRALLALFGWDTVPHLGELYFFTRALRVFYSMTILLLFYHLVKRVLGSRYIALVGLLLLALSPLSSTVTHFATGDIGTSLFALLTLWFLWNYQEQKGKIRWLLFCGVCIGASFSAKYNGLLVGIAPGVLLLYELVCGREVKRFVLKVGSLVGGTVVGIALLTPGLVLDFKPTFFNILRNFEFIKDYKTPKEVLALDWLPRVLLGIETNWNTVVNGLGGAMFYIALLVLPLSLVGLRRLHQGQADESNGRKTEFLAVVSSLVVLAVAISLVGKYRIQPFHFSYLVCPVILCACALLQHLVTSPRSLYKGCGLLLLCLVVGQLAMASWRDNFFWRLDDNKLYARYLARSVFTSYDRDDNIGPLRSLVIEDGGVSEFRNHRHFGRGPDADIWHAVAAPPVPTITNDVLARHDWVFINGPTFPRDDRILFLNGGG